jgi:hypothetical protein
MLRVVSNISPYVKSLCKTMNAFDPELGIKLFQSTVVVVSGVLALYFNRRLAKEMAGKFKAVYGKLFNMERVFEAKWMIGYLRFGFILFGICAIIFAVFNITGPIK